MRPLSKYPPARLTSELWFPSPEAIESSHNGLVAVGGDLSSERLLLAYRSGIFPWTVNPVTWWSPDPRGVIDFESFHVSRSLARTIRRGKFDVTFDQAFKEVMQGCAKTTAARGRSWVTPEFIQSYQELHRLGHAHSVECWNKGRLVGGVYGVSVGGLFAGESMFHRESDASKVALFHLVDRLEERGFLLFDTQMVTPITSALGAVELTRHEYLTRLKQALKISPIFDKKDFTGK